MKVEGSEWYGEPELAALGIVPDELRRAAQAGTIKIADDGARIVVQGSELLKYLDNRAAEPPKAATPAGNRRGHFLAKPPAPPNKSTAPSATTAATHPIQHAPALAAARKDPTVSTPTTEVKKQRLAAAYETEVKRLMGTGLSRAAAVAAASKTFPEGRDAFNEVRG